MKSRFVCAAAALVAVIVEGGCSSGPSPAKSGSLPPGSALFTIGGDDVGTIKAVQCQPVETVTTINAGDDKAGATVMLSTAQKLTVEFVRIRNLNGFTGDYNRGLEGTAEVALSGVTYAITGAALGFGRTSFERTTEPFTIKVAC